jgi:hypothetical protein
MLAALGCVAVGSMTGSASAALANGGNTDDPVPPRRQRGQTFHDSGFGLIY